MSSSPEDAFRKYSPENIDCKIWRYFDWWKFQNLIESRKLFFARGDCLGESFEGTFPERFKDDLSKAIEHHFPKEEYEALHSLKPKFLEGRRKYAAISCWHENEHENHQMWQTYLKDPKNGVAIQTTVRDLKESLGNVNGLSVCKVVYIDFNTETIPGNPPDIKVYENFAFKKLEFKSDNEIRFCSCKEESLADGVVYINGKYDYIPKDTVPEPGIPVKIGLEKMIKRIYLCPHASQVLHERTIELVSRNGLSCEIHKSNIDGSPNFHF